MGHNSRTFSKDHKNAKSSKEGTKKNIKTSLNKLQARNETLFGSAGRNFYNPNSRFDYGGAYDMYPFGGVNTKTHTHMAQGGWLNKYEGGGPKAQVDVTTPEDLVNMKGLGYPIYTGQKDFYDKFKDAKTFVKTKANPKGINSPFFYEPEGDAKDPLKNSWINEGWDGYDDYPLRYNYQEFVPSTDHTPVCKGEQCTARANRAIGTMYFQTGDSFYQNPDVTKKDMGVTYTTAAAPTAAQQQQYDYMIGDKEFGSLDAWDVVQQAKKKIPKNVLYSAVVDVPKEAEEDSYARSEYVEKYEKTALKAKDVWKKYDIPIGSYINVGLRTGGPYINSRKDIIAGSHTLRVTGYTDEGEPLVADYGTIVPLSKSMYADDSHDFVAGIVTVPGKEKYTYKWFKEQARAASKPNTTPYVKDIKSEKYGGRYKTFHDNIVKEKNYIATKLGVDSQTYDQYAKIALTLGGVETDFGKGKVFNLPFLDSMGESTGVAQVTESNVADKYKKTLAKYKDDPEAYNAMSALLYVRELDKYKDKWLKSGEKAGERPFNRTDESSIKNIVREAQGRKQQGYINSDIVLSGPGSNGKSPQDVFRYTDANDKPREIRLPFKQFWQSDADYEEEVNEVLKKEDPTLRFSDKGDKGGRTIYKKTKGNTIPKTLEDFVYYAWQTPNAVAYGDAQGNSTYYQKAKAIQAKLFGEKLAQKKLGGASDWLDKYATGGPIVNAPNYEKWKAKLPKALQYEGDYDLRGLYNSNPNTKPSADLHFPDTFKLPNHPTFSEESIYAKPPLRFGSWSQESQGDYLPPKDIYSKYSNGGTTGEWLDKYEDGQEVSSGDPKTKKRFSPLLQSVMDDRASNVSNPKAKIPASLINPAYNNVKVAPTKQATISQTKPDYRSAIAKKEEMQRGLENENLILNKQTGQYQKSLVENTPANQMKLLLGAGAAPFIAAGALSGAGRLASSGIWPALGTALEASPSWASGLSINNAFGVLGMNSIVNKGLLSDEYAKNIRDANGAWETTMAVGEPVFDVFNAVSLATKMGPAFYNAAQNLGKYLTEETALKNASKLNPKAFKENPLYYYRGIGEEGLKTAQETNLIGSKNPQVYTSPYFAKQGDFKIAKHFNPDVIVEAKGKSLYDDLTNLNKDDLVFTRSNMGSVPLKHSSLSKVTPGVNLEGDLADVGLEGISLNNPNIRILKKDWWQGYKPIEFNKNIPGSSNVGASVENKLINSNTQLSDPIHIKAVEHVNENVKNLKSIPKSQVVNSQFGHTYVLPEGMTIDNLNMSDLEGAKLDDVYNSIVKLNPELKNINVPKKHVLGAVSSNMAPQDIADINKLPRVPQFIEHDPTMGFVDNFKKAYNETKWKNFTDTHEGFDFRFSPERQKEIMRSYNPKLNVDAVDDVGRGLTRNTNELPPPPHEIILDEHSINLERLTPKNKRKMMSFDDSDIGGGLTLRNNPSRVKNTEDILGTKRSIKSVMDKKTGESIDLKTWKDDDGQLYYYMSANMPSSKIKAGKAYMEIEKHIPKGASLLENSSLSYDSFLNILKQTKNPKFETFVKGKIDMNNSAKNAAFKIKPMGTAGLTEFAYKKHADNAVNELNLLLDKYNLPNANVTNEHGNYSIQLPNIGLKKLYSIIGLNAIGAGALQQKKRGGWLDNY